MTIDYKNTINEEVEKFRIDLLKKLGIFDEEKVRFKELELANIYNLHNKGIKGKGVKVGIIDKGFSTLNGKVSYTSIVDYNGNTPEDTYGHGTLVAEKFKGVDIGIAPDVELYAYQRRDEEKVNYGKSCLKSMIEGFKYFLENKVDIINVSLCVEDIDLKDQEDLKLIKELYNVLQQLKDKGTIVVAAAGNNGTAPVKYSIPASSDNVIAVGACDDKLVISDYSNKIKHDIIGQADNRQSYNKYGELYTLKEGGTSSATPVVAAIGALLLQQKPDLTFKQLLYLLKDNSIPVEGDSYNVGMAKGIIIDENTTIGEVYKSNNSLEIIEKDILTKIEEEEKKKIAIELEEKSKYFILDKLNILPVRKAGFDGSGIRVASTIYGCNEFDDYNIKAYYDYSGDGKVSCANDSGNKFVSILNSKEVGIAPGVELYVYKKSTQTGMFLNAKAKADIGQIIKDNIDIAVIRDNLNDSEIDKLINAGVILITPATLNPSAMKNGKGQSSKNKKVISVASVDSNNNFTNEGLVEENLAILGYGNNFTYRNKYGILEVKEELTKARWYNDVAACYQVAGVLALIKQQKPDLTYLEAKEYLINNSKDIGLKYGLVQAEIL